jgi:hypothetical protein
MVGHTSILEPKGHYRVAVGAKRCDEEHLDLIFLFKRDLVITRVAI